VPPFNDKSAFRNSSTRSLLRTVVTLTSMPSDVYPAGAVTVCGVFKDAALLG
jgi:hypothetical protein